MHRLTAVDHGLLLIAKAAFALGAAVVPFSLVAPRSETLMAGVIAGEMTVLDESLLVMATGDEVDLLVEAHLDWREMWLGTVEMIWLGQLAGSWRVHMAMLLTVVADVA